MKLAIGFFLVVVLWSCSVKPEPLNYGKDACHACKMTLVDKRFGGEIVTSKGKVYKFDDVSCMIGFYESGFVPTAEVHSILVVDYTTEAELIDATKATYVISEQVKSPMVSNTAAFAQQADAEKQNAAWNGKMLDWNGVLTAF